MNEIGNVNVTRLAGISKNFIPIQLQLMLRLGPRKRRTDILSCMQLVLHAGQIGVLFLNNFALVEQWQNSERLNFIIFRGKSEFPT